MSKVLLNDHWSFMYQWVEGRKEALPSEEVTLPHDAVYRLNRYPDQPNGTGKGFYPNVRLLYAKKLSVPAEWQGKYVCLQFEGVYSNARVYVNGCLAGSCRNGYQRFYVDIYPYLKYGEENEIAVEASTDDDARWYTGAGIYRDVFLIVSEPLHYCHGGVKIRTLSADEDIAVLEIRQKVTNNGFTAHSVEAVVKITDPSGALAAEDHRTALVRGNKETEIISRVYVNNPQLWDVDSPVLYQIQAGIYEGEKCLDDVSFRTGIRTLGLDNVHGFRLNGKAINLYGGCIHHDNGIVGSAAFKAAEYRKISMMKSLGYNAVRFSHNCMSEDLLDACDHYGMIVMDELTDYWQKSKTSGDQSLTFEADWREIMKAMIDKDYNHPSVAMYSIGNEITVLGTLSGNEFGRELANTCRAMDPSRYVTSAINGFTCIMPPPAVTDPTVQKDPAEINAMMTKMISNIGAMQCREDVITASREFSETLDIVGYNYAEEKQLIDSERFTNRICVGTETFPNSLAKNWKLVQENANIIGDFVWTAWDYIGECGVGKNGLKGDWVAGLYEGFPYKLANIGDIDITGTRKPVSYYRECVMGLRNKPYISVHHPARYGQELLTTPWSWSDSVSAWTWRGFEGQPIRVEVYGKGEEAELIINGNSVERKEIPQESTGTENAFCTVFDTVYQPGVAEAVIYCNGQEIGRTAVTTAGDETILHVSEECEGIDENVKDLQFYEIQLTDRNEILKPDQDRLVKVSVQGDGQLVGLGSANPISQESFGASECTTYYGRAAFAVHLTGKGKFHILIESEGCESVEITVDR